MDQFSLSGRLPDYSFSPKFFLREWLRVITTADPITGEAKIREAKNGVTIIRTDSGKNATMNQKRLILKRLRSNREYIYSRRIDILR